MTAENLREKCEALEKENAELKKEQSEAPNFSDPSSVVSWHGHEIIRYLGMARKEKASTRLRLLNSSIDSWSRASRLAHDSSELEQLKQDLASLRQMIEGDRGLQVIK